MGESRRWNEGGEGAHRPFIVRAVASRPRLLTNLYLNVAERELRLYLTALDEYHFPVLNTAETISGQLIK